MDGLPAREWHPCDCRSRRPRLPEPGIRQHQYQPAHMTWKMALYKRSNAVAVHVSDSFDDQIVREVRDGAEVRHIDIPDLFAIIVNSIHHIDSQL